MLRIIISFAYLIVLAAVAAESNNETSPFWRPKPRLGGQTPDFIEVENFDHDRFIAGVELVTRVPAFWATGEYDAVFELLFQKSGHDRAVQKRVPFSVSEEHRGRVLSLFLSAKEIIEASSAVKIVTSFLTGVRAHFAPQGSDNKIPFDFPSSTLSGSIVIAREGDIFPRISFLSPLTQYSFSEFPCTSTNIPHVPNSSDLIVDVDSIIMDSSRTCIVTYRSQPSFKRFGTELRFEEATGEEAADYWSPGTRKIHKTKNVQYLEVKNLQKSELVASLSFVSKISPKWSDGSHEVVYSLSFESGKSVELRRPFEVTKDRSGFVSQQLSVSDLRSACLKAGVSCQHLKNIDIYITKLGGAPVDLGPLSVSEITGSILVIDMERIYAGYKRFRSPLTIYAKTQVDCDPFFLPYFKVSPDALKVDIIEQSINKERYCIMTHNESSSADRVQQHFLGLVAPSGESISPFWGKATGYVEPFHHYIYYDFPRAASNSLIPDVVLHTRVVPSWAPGPYDLDFGFVFGRRDVVHYAIPFMINAGQTGYISQHLSAETIYTECSKAKRDARDILSIQVALFHRGGYPKDGLLLDTEGLELSGSSVLIDNQRRYAGPKRFVLPLTLYIKSRGSCRSYELPSLELSTDPQIKEKTIGGVQYCVETYVSASRETQEAILLKPYHLSPFDA